MKVMRWAIACLVVCASALASDAPRRGTVPRPAPDKYPAHAEQNSVAIGAALLSDGEVHKVFYSDVGRCCVVVEVALYPKDLVAEPSLDDFALRIVGQDVATKPDTPKTAALHSSRESDRLRPRIIFAIEDELTEKGLPDDPTTTPVSGYLYFPKPKKGKYQLEYTLHGNTVVLPLSARR